MPEYDIRPMVVHNRHGMWQILKKSLKTRLNILEGRHQLPHSDSCRSVGLQLNQVLSHNVQRLHGEGTPNQTITSSSGKFNKITDKLLLNKK